MDLKKFFARNGKALRLRRTESDSDYHPSDKSGEGLEVEYQGLIASQFRRWGISTSCATIEVRRLGQAPDGYDVFVGMVRVVEWERTSALRLLLGLPLLEAKARKTIRATWLVDYSHFGGLWLHASERVHGDGELHRLLAQLAPVGYGAAAGPPSRPEGTLSRAT
jgi:hypothetical protein